MASELIIEAAYKLNLRALEQFARALCAGSRVQLFPPPKKKTAPTWIQKWLPHVDQAAAEPLLLDAVSFILLRACSFLWIYAVLSRPLLGITFKSLLDSA